MERDGDLAVLREILQRELETINHYETLADRVKDPALRQIVLHITDEEREHVAETYQLLLERDPGQKERWDRAHLHLEGLTKEPSPGAPPNDPPAKTAEPEPQPTVGDVRKAATTDPIPPPPPIFPDGAFSVGPLKKKK